MLMVNKRPETEKEEEQSKVNEEVRGGSDEADSGAELGNKDSDSWTDATANWKIKDTWMAKEQD